MKKKRLRNYQLIREKDSSLPPVPESERKVVIEGVDIDYSVFQKSEDEKLRLKIEKARHKQEIISEP